MDNFQFQFISFQFQNCPSQFDTGLERDFPNVGLGDTDDPISGSFISTFDK